MRDMAEILHDADMAGVCLRESMSSDTGQHTLASCAMQSFTTFMPPRRGCVYPSLKKTAQAPRLASKELVAAAFVTTPRTTTGTDPLAPANALGALFILVCEVGGRKYDTGDGEVRGKSVCDKSSD